MPGNLLAALLLWILLIMRRIATVMATPKSRLAGEIGIHTHSIAYVEVIRNQDVPIESRPPGFGSPEN
jgi:hypothetical protein